ncbi:MAG: hypothetical protein DRO14_03865 [Thermoprotei archaeon]|nr:MAG: hypothetical protein DRO14_03865 [Thermoprotei archaeon]
MRNRKSLTIFLISLPAFGYIIFWFLIPSLNLVAFSIYTKKGMGVQMEIRTTPTLENYIEALSGWYLDSLIWTIGVATVIATVAIIIALPVAYYLSRIEGPKAFIDLSLLFPFFGGIFYGYALLYAFAPQGIINWLLMNLHIISEPIRLLKTNESAVIVMTIVDTSLAIMLLRSSLIDVDPVYEEAAMTLGATPIKTFFKIDLPLVKRALAGAWLLIFGGELASYNIPYIVAGPHNKWISTMLYRELTQYTNFPLSASIAVVLTLLSSGVLLLYMKIFERG